MSLQKSDKLSFSHYVVLFRLLQRDGMLKDFIDRNDLSAFTVRQLSELVDMQMRLQLIPGTGTRETKSLADKLEKRLEVQLSAAKLEIENQNPDEKARREVSKVLRKMARMYRDEADRLSGKKPLLPADWHQRLETTVSIREGWPTGWPFPFCGRVGSP